MVFVETSLFTAQITALVSDDAYQELQKILLSDPKAGSVIPDTGGLRKIRIASGGHGKRGGARVIYYHRTVAGQFLMLMAYAKNEAEDLTPKQAAALKKIANNWRGT